MFCLDALESRRMLSVTLENGVLTVSGTHRGDAIFISQANSLDGRSAHILVMVNDELHSYGLSDFTKVVIRGGRGQDLIVADKFVQTVGSSKHRFEFPDPTVYKAGGVMPGSISFVFEGGDDNDTIWGGHASETIYGGAGDDIVYSGSGSDKVFGDVGADTLVGDRGNDSLYGGSGNDELNAGEDNDYLDGGSHGDMLLGGKGTDTLVGGNGNDRLYGGVTGSLMEGGRGNDSVFGGIGADTIYGGAGQDTFSKNDSARQWRDFSSEDVFAFGSTNPPI